MFYQALRINILDIKGEHILEEYHSMVGAMHLFFIS